MALKGDTIRLEVLFRDFDGKAISPTNVTLSIYDEYNVAIQSFPLSDDDSVSEGRFFYDYTIPYDVNNFIIYEFYGIKNGKPFISRDKIHVDFV